MVAAERRRWQSSGAQTGPKPTPSQAKTSIGRIQDTPAWPADRKPKEKE
jgi:hypothetical protein